MRRPEFKSGADIRKRPCERGVMVLVGGLALSITCAPASEVAAKARVAKAKAM
jgi:hypothetical protein